MIPPEEKKKTESINPWQQRERALRAWGLLLFGVIGATVTAFAVGQLRRNVDWFYTQLNKSQPNSSWSSTSNSNRGRYREEAWKRYNRRMQEEYKEEMERVERIRRMQSVFNRERNKYKRSYERWRENGPGAYEHFQQDDWYWNTETYYSYQRTNFRSSTRDSGDHSMSHHYSVLGLDRSRAKPYTEEEIKTAFRAKAMKYHPDQNQGNKEVAEAKFKEVMTSYEAIKSERKNAYC